MMADCRHVAQRGSTILGRAKKSRAGSSSHVDRTCIFPAGRLSLQKSLEATYMSIPLPSHDDFNACGCLDAESAWRHFGGLSLAEAQLKFRENPEGFQEHFMWMGGKAFAFYFPVIECWLLESPELDAEDDERCAWILAKDIGMQFTDPIDEVLLLAPRVLVLGDFVRANLSTRFASNRENQQRIAQAWDELEILVRSQKSPKSVSF
jgi:hypothetical protein